MPFLADIPRATIVWNPHRAWIIYVIALFSLALSGCSKQKGNLTAKQMERITEIRRTFTEVDVSTFQQSVDDFSRISDPEKEIDTWERMARAYKKYTDSHSLSLEAKKEVFKIVLFRSIASEEKVLSRVKLNLLTVDQAKAIMESY